MSVDLWSVADCCLLAVGCGLLVSLVVAVDTEVAVVRVLVLGWWLLAAGCWLLVAVGVWSWSWTWCLRCLLLG